MEEKLKISKLRAAGYSPDDVRAQVSSRLRSTNHFESRRLINTKSRTAIMFYTCLGCGHERVFGVEELQ